ncbi:MAG: hypothetical protein ACOYB1_11775 [Limnohabitans sp.]
MRISEVVGDRLMSFVAVVRCAVDGTGSVTTQVEIRCDGLTQARCLLARAYGRANVLNIRQTVLEQSQKPIEPSASVIRPIKPLTPKQAMKKSLTDTKQALKKKERKTKAINRVRAAQNQLADINRQV